MLKLYVVYFSERLENLYTQLKNELLDPSNSLEEVFVKLRELKLGMERNFAIKRFFWKASFETNIILL